MLPLQRVDAVADPDPVGMLHHPEIDPAAAGGAGLDLQTGVGLLQFDQQPVEGLVCRAAG